MAKPINHHRSSVVCCEIDPTSLNVISGSTDSRIFVSSCYIPEIDDTKMDPKNKALAKEFGTKIYEFRPDSWIDSVAWNKSGNLGFAAAQNATIAILDYNGKKTDLVKCKHSPITLIVPTGDNSFLAVCYDRNILEYEKKGDKWEVKRTITTDTGKKAGGPSKGNVSAALQKFQVMGQQKKENLAVTSKQSSHLHQSLISSLSIKGKDIITTDVSGFVKYWKL